MKAKLLLVLFLGSCSTGGQQKARGTSVTIVPSAIIPGCAGNPPSRSLSKPEMEQLARLLKSTVWFRTPVMLDFSSPAKLVSRHDLPTRYAELASDGSLLLVEPNHMVQYFVDKRESSDGVQWTLRVCREAE